MSAGKQGATSPRRSRGRPTQEDAAAIESRLLAVALQEFLRLGYEGASMAGIVKAAGVSKTTLYSRYPSKEQLFRAIVYQQIERMTPALPLQSPDGSPNLERGLKSYANHMLELSSKGELLGINHLIYSESFRFPELGAAVLERAELGVKRISNFIRECAAADGISCRDPEAVAEAFILMIRGWYLNQLLGDREVSETQRREWVDRSVHTLLSARVDW